MNAKVMISGSGHAIGSLVIQNEDTSIFLGLAPNSLKDRTGIVSRHICGQGEDVTTLALAAVRNCIEDAGLATITLQRETVLIYIQNGLQYLTPPPGIVLAHRLGLPTLRVLSLDGVCSEPIHAIEIASLMLERGTCERVIICASADFTPIVDPHDEDTAGLFGSGAGAILMRRSKSDEQGEIRGITWETDATFWDLGTIGLTQFTTSPTGVHADFTYYHMKGQELARVAVRIIRRVIDRTLQEAGWLVTDIDHIATHQPNPKMLDVGFRRLGLPMSKTAVPGRTLGNMGPASVLIALSLLRQNGTLSPGTRTLLLSFGLGFSCGSAALYS